MNLKSKIIVSVAAVAMSTYTLISGIHAVNPITFNGGIVQRTPSQLRLKNESDLYEAINSHNYSGVLSLVEDNGVDVNTTNSDQETPLNLAVRVNDFGIVKLLVEHHADVNAPGKYGMLPLHLAALLGRYEIVEYLVEHGSADINKVGIGGDTPLHFAICGECYKIFKYLMLKKPNLDAQNNASETPLHVAVVLSNPVFACDLIAEGADCTVENKKHETAIQIAGSTFYRKDAVVKALRLKGVMV